jgi:hypothetical protein
MWVTDDLRCPYCLDEQDDNEDGMRQTEFDEHHECARIYLRLTRSTNTAYCECDDCVFDNKYHYMNNDLMVDENMSPYCAPCLAGIHPEPPTEQAEA